MSDSLTVYSAAKGLKDPSLFVQKVYIAGEWRDAATGATTGVTNPATREIIGTIPRCGADETREAIAAADTAFKSWRKMPAGERAAILREWHRLIMANKDDLGRIMTMEQGKPLAEAVGEITYAASFVSWFAEEARRVYGMEVPAPSPDRRILVRKEPVGVCAAITPWNFPAAMITRKAAPALAAGCTMVVKPAEATPFTALALAVLAERAGVPKGVLSVVTGDSRAIGGEMTGSETVRMLSFTGSTGVGAKLIEQCAGTVKKLGMELGGNAPFIVFDDADIDTAVEGIMASKFRNAGQTCVCANRIFVQSGIHDALVEALGKKVRALKVGNGLEDGITTGPLIDDKADAKVAEHVDDALAKGASIFARADAPDGFTAPVVLTGVKPGMLLMDEETFGPLAGIVKFDTEEDALTMANDTPFGLASYFYTRDMARAWRVSEGLEYGMVGLNTGAISMAEAPFGGVKQSGLGREGGTVGMEEFLEMKTLHWAGLS
ncbi:NAD-dependent succinate-semialdehyde dehydrogenase [Croceicoccus sp. Ery5]|uniref:NAD-dependent succinate-semialdehyde dehydrogenase n=1 Tax=Croceicoccus sp. Ery5 TaxID=1703340 RepID=UPI001E39B50C|nr:NAD-dependent succinate-semialdehyde dehydrogenase [Croceicoccus sp. Ery5]